MKSWFVQVTVQPSQRTKRFCVAATPQLLDVLVVRLSLSRPSLNPTAMRLWRRLGQLQHCHRSIYRPPTGNRIEVRVFRSRIDPRGVLRGRFRFRIWMSSRIPPREKPAQFLAELLIFGTRYSKGNPKCVPQKLVSLVTSRLLRNQVLHIPEHGVDRVC